MVALIVAYTGQEGVRKGPARGQDRPQRWCGDGQGAPPVVLELSRFAFNGV